MVYSLRTLKKVQRDARGLGRGFAPLFACRRARLSAWSGFRFRQASMLGPKVVVILRKFPVILLGCC